MTCSKWLRGEVARPRDDRPRAGSASSTMNSNGKPTDAAARVRRLAAAVAAQDRCSEAMEELPEHGVVLDSEILDVDRFGPPDAFGEIQ